MLSARESLLKIEAVLSVSEGYLTNGGIELSETEFEYINKIIKAGLGVTDAQN